MGTMKVLPIENNRNLVRDMNSKAVLNTNRKELEEYQIKTRAVSSMKKQAEEINSMKKQLTELAALKNDFEEIKTMLLSVINKQK